MCVHGLLFVVVKRGQTLQTDVIKSSNFSFHSQGWRPGFTYIYLDLFLFLFTNINKANSCVRQSLLAIFLVTMVMSDAAAISVHIVTP